MNFLIACATCMPDPSSDVAKAANMTLIFMLAVLALVLGIIIKVGFNFARRQRQFAEASQD